MASHRYLRAYMAGVVIPSATVFLVALPVAAMFARIPVRIERAMLFPMALNPALWGVWNMLYAALPQTRRLPIAWHGVALAFVLIASGTALAPCLGISFVTPVRALTALGPTAIAYYVLWRFAVAALNEILGIEHNRMLDGSPEK